MYMVNMEKYKNDGWGLSQQCFFEIEKILNDFKMPIVVEFGSGISTQFLVDYMNETNKDGKIISFDNDKQYKSDIATLKKLVECSDKDFNDMFLNKKYDSSKMNYRIEKPHTRQKNCFYDISPDDIPNNINLVIVDGPHGNGRSFSFLHIKEKLMDNGYIVVDDYNHYDFSDRLLQIFSNAEIIKESNTGSKNQWELGGNYRIFKIKK